MSYWQDIKEVIKKGVELAGEGINKGTETVVEKTKTGVSILQLRKDLWTKQRDFHKALAEMGDMSFDLFKEGEDISKNPQFKTLFEKTEALEKECKKLEAEIKETAQK